MTLGDGSSDAGPARSRRRSVRWAWSVLGLLCVGLGTLGAVVPGLPTTVFFIAAAACFTRSSPRLEAWVLNLAGVGPLVREYRAGLGMPRRAKVAAIGAIVLAGGLSITLGLQSTLPRVVVGLACVVAIAVIIWRVPTRETVTAQRRAAHGEPSDRR